MLDSLRLTLIVWLVVGSAAWAQKPAAGVTGFEVDLVYQAPDVEHPSVVTCDSSGSLFVGEDPIDMRGPTSKEFDRVLLIRFDPKTGQPTKTVFCQNLAPVFGLLWVDDALYVMHAPHYSVFRDTDGDGVADERKDLVEGFGAPVGKYGLNDHIVSGIQRGLDGRVYVSVGDKGIPRAVGSDGSTITLEGGGIVSMRLDGSQLEVVTSGTRNHLDVALDALDNMFTFDNTDDGLGWWTRYTHQVPTGYYGYPYDFLKHPERHLAALSEHGGGSPAGAACYLEAAWPEQYRGNAFHCEWAKGKIQRFVPRRNGAGFTGELIDFVERDGPAEFRPIDLCFSPDGRNMYVADWNFEGSLKPNVAGRLWRVRYTGSDVPPEPARIRDDAPLVNQLQSLGHPAQTERVWAQKCLVRAGAKAIEPVTALLGSAEASTIAKAHAIWTLADLADAVPAYDATAAWIAALDDPDADVRAQAARALGQRRKATASGRLISALSDQDAAVRMWAVIALGRIGDPQAVPALTAALADADPLVRYTAIQALRGMNQWQTARQSLASDDPIVRQAMLVALTGIYDEAAVAALIWAAKEAPDRSLHAAAIQSLAEVQRRADSYTGGWWGIQPAKGKPARVKKHDWSATSQITAIFLEALADADPAVRGAAIAALVEAREAGAAPQLALLAENRANPLELRIAAVRGLARLGGSGVDDSLVKILQDPETDTELVTAALASVAARKSEAALAAVRRLLSADDPEIRSHALETVGQVRGAAAAGEIEPAFADPEREVRQAALRLAGELMLRDSIDRIVPLVADQQVREEAMLALAAMPDRRALSVYLDGVTHKSPSVRQASRRALIELRATAGADITDRYRRGELLPALLAELQSVLNAPAPIDTWHVLGPWPRSNPPALDPAIRPKLSEPLVIDGRPSPWRTVTSRNADGQTMLGDAFQSTGGKCALAYAALECDQDYATTFQAGCDGDAVIWINGVQVATLLGNRTWGPTALQGRVSLKKGTNHIWVRTGADEGKWSFSVAVGTRRPEYEFLYQGVPQALDAGAYRDFALKNPGDAQRGREIFADVKGVGCIKCHAVAGQGAKIGPDLTGIGTRYPRAELIRSVLEPSNRVAEAYQVTTIVTQSGKVYSGIIKSNTEDLVELIDVDGRVVSLASDDVEERRPSNLSLMPNGLKDGLTPESFADIVAYLQSLK